MSDYDPNYVQKKNYFLVGQKAIVSNNKNEILILQRSEKSGLGAKWSLPGGALEENENPIESIKREIIEETKLEVTDVKPFSSKSYSQEGDSVLIVGYICKANSSNVVLNWEHDNYKWLVKNEALKLDLTEDGKFFIEQFE